MNARTCACVAAAVITGLLGGCGAFDGQRPSSSTPPVTMPKTPPPSFTEMASRYNERVEPLARLFGRANIRLTYFDENGEQKTEEPEGRLQVVRPDRLALSLGKAGQILFWFGCDAEKYWWFDLTDSSKRILAMGRHDKYTDAIAKRIGLPIRPLDLIRVLGIIPLDPKAQGATQWSRDGSQIGVTTAIGRRGFQRIWIDRRTDLPSSIEIFGPDRQLILSARHQGQEPIELASGRFRPPIAADITVTHYDSQTEARLTLTGLKDTGVSDKAFDLRTLLEKYPVDREIDLDAPRPAPAQPAAPRPKSIEPFPGPSTPAPAGGKG